MSNTCNVSVAWNWGYWGSCLTELTAQRYHHHPVLVYKRWSFNNCHYRVASFPLKLTQFTYETFKCNELLRWSSSCKCNTFAPFPSVKEKLAILHRYVCAGTNSLFSLCTQHGSCLILHSNISVGNVKMAEMHAEATPLPPSMPKKEKILVQLTGKMWHFLCCDTFISSNWYLVWNR